MANTTNDQPGNEARHHGDRLGFPHPVSDETALDDVSNLDPGVPVTFDGTDLAESTAVSDDHVGILLTLPVYGDSSRSGPYVDGDKDATVGVRGSYTADLTDFSPTVGTYLDDNNNIYVKAEIDSTNNVYEVIVR